MNKEMSPWCATRTLPQPHSGPAWELGSCAAWKASLTSPSLIGTWAAAAWAIEFYRRNGFTVIPSSEKDRLLRTYWSIPTRQIETSVVLADRRWMEAQQL